METLARLYVEHFTENIVRHSDYGGNLTVYGNVALHEGYEGVTDLEHYLLFKRFPTFVAILDDNERFIYGAEKLRELAENPEIELPVGMAREIYNKAGERLTVAMYRSVSGTFWVVGAISWSDMPGATAMTIFLWPVLIASMALWSTFAVSNLWHHVINPIRWLEERVSSLKWGAEPLDEKPLSATAQVKKMHDTLVRVSKEAMKTAQVNRTCMNDLVNVQEDERTKISRDIHDGPLQDVTALIQRIHLARRADNTPEETRSELDLAEKIAYATVKEMRALCDFLNPPWLELGLSQALTELTERQSLQYGVKIFLGVDDDLDMPDSVTLAFFRVVQEAVTNSVRHGEAKNIWIDLKRNDDGTELTIQDDGHGFEIKEGDTADLRAEGHRGLSNMEERMTLIGGRLKIISYLGEGTCIRGLLP
jgi:signal transduction histidine kinase